MDTTTLFTAALGLEDPWYVTLTEFKDAADGSKFTKQLSTDFSGNILKHFTFNGIITI